VRIIFIILTVAAKHSGIETANFIIAYSREKQQRLAWFQGVIRSIVPIRQKQKSPLRGFLNARAISSV
jgi:hypothetical protein